CHRQSETAASRQRSERDRRDPHHDCEENQSAQAHATTAIQFLIRHSKFGIRNSMDPSVPISGEYDALSYVNDKLAGHGQPAPPKIKNPKRLYAELRAASAFSFLDGASLPEDLIYTAAEIGVPAMAIIDRNGVYGAPRFFGAAKKTGVK